MDILKNIKFEKVTPSNEETIDLYRIPSTQGCVEIIKLTQKFYRPHIHNKASAELHVLEGVGTIILNGKERNYKPGDIFEVRKGTSHGFKIKKETILLSIQDKAILNKETGKIDLRYE